MNGMKQRMQAGSLIVSIVLLVAWTTASDAAEGAATTGASYLMHSIGAKSIAMGDVKSALTGEPFSWVANPGLLGAAGGYGIGVSHTEWILDTRYDNVSYYCRVHPMLTLGGDLVFTYRPTMQGYDEYGTKTGELKSNNYHALIGVGFSPIPSLTAGVNIKYFRERLAEWKAGGVGFDLGLLCTIEKANASIGFAAQNIGPDIRFDAVNEPLPTTIRFGFSHHVDVDRYNIGLTSAFDLVKPRFESLYLNAGCELALYRAAAVRIGYCGQESRAGDGFTLGGGVLVRSALAIDYAWTPYGDLGDFHHISLSYGSSR